MGLVLAVALFAQILTPGVAYTTADPINADRFGLATVDGRYMVELSDTGDCTGIGPDMRVMVWQTPSPDGTAMYTAVKPIDDNGEVVDQDYCYVIIDRKMDNTPCFQTDGVCDVDGTD